MKCMKWMLISLAYNSMMNEEKELSLRLKLLEMRERIWLADGRLRRRGVLAEIARELGVSRQCVGTAARRAINGREPRNQYYERVRRVYGPQSEWPPEVLAYYRKHYKKRKL
jgi:hypothetical protein